MSVYDLICLFLDDVPDTQTNPPDTTGEKAHEKMEENLDDRHDVCLSNEG
jgi:hypothetical protein